MKSLTKLVLLLVYFTLQFADVLGKLHTGTHPIPAKGHVQFKYFGPTKLTYEIYSDTVAFDVYLFEEKDYFVWAAHRNQPPNYISTGTKTGVTIAKNEFDLLEKKTYYIAIYNPQDDNAALVSWDITYSVKSDYDKYNDLHNQLEKEEHLEIGVIFTTIYSAVGSLAVIGKFLYNYLRKRNQAEQEPNQQEVENLLN